MIELKLTEERINKLKIFFDQCLVTVKFTEGVCQVKFSQGKHKQTLWGEDKLLTTNQIERIEGKILEDKTMKLKCWANQSYANKQICNELGLIVPSLQGTVDQLKTILKCLEFFKDEKLMSLDAKKRLSSAITDNFNSLVKNNQNVDNANYTQEYEDSCIQHVM